MARQVLIDTVCELMLFNQHLEINTSVVGEQEEYARDEKLVVPIVDLQPLSNFRRVAKVNEDLPRWLVQEESICKTS